jgi:RNA polymerase sigma-70 factor (ECF subfamily)
MLEDMQREAFFLVYVETLSYREAAAILEVPIETVMAQLANARERLAKLAAGSADPTPTQVKSG